MSLAALVPGSRGPRSSSVMRALAGHDGVVIASPLSRIGVRLASRMHVDSCRVTHITLCNSELTLPGNGMKQGDVAPRFSAIAVMSIGAIRKRWGYTFPLPIDPGSVARQPAGIVLFGMAARVSFSTLQRRSGPGSALILSSFGSDWLPARTYSRSSPWCHFQCDVGRLRGPSVVLLL